MIVGTFKTVLPDVEISGIIAHPGCEIYQAVAQLIIKWLMVRKGYRCAPIILKHGTKVGVNLTRHGFPDKSSLLSGRYKTIERCRSIIFCIFPGVYFCRVD